METHGTSPESAANFRMIDIGEKSETQRRAVASGLFIASRETISRIRNRSLPKGDVLVLAEVAGIQGAKRTSDLLPLCHPLALTSVRVWTEIADTEIRVFCEAKTVGKTGVEMEALCGVNAALLCIYDLTKVIDPVLEIGSVRLETKEGGKSGKWVNPSIQPRSESASGLFTSLQKNAHLGTLPNLSLKNITAVVITLSDRCFKKEYEDRSGPAASCWLEDRGALVKRSLILPDDRDQLCRSLLNLLEKDAPNLIVTSGGTGLSKRDITPETLIEVCREHGGREIPGVGELLRQDGATHNKNAWLSRSTAILVRDTLIVCLPGNPAAVTEGLTAIGGLIRHALHIGSGGAHDLGGRS